MVMVGSHRSGEWEASETVPSVTGSTPRPRRGVGTSSSRDDFAPCGGASRDARPRGPRTEAKALVWTHRSMREKKDI